MIILGAVREQLYPLAPLYQRRTQLMMERHRPATHAQWMMRVSLGCDGRTDDPDPHKAVIPCRGLIDAVCQERDIERRSDFAGSGFSKPTSQELGRRLIPAVDPLHDGRDHHPIAKLPAPARPLSA